jgi:hypothetical protein
VSSLREARIEEEVGGFWCANGDEEEEFVDGDVEYGSVVVDGASSLNIVVL